MQETVDKLIADVKAQIEKYGSFSKSTAPTNAYGWSTTEHNAMSKVADAFRQKGYEVSRNVSFEVTDWEIHPPVTVTI